jgi:hypothetical protein
MFSAARLKQVILHSLSTVNTPSLMLSRIFCGHPLLCVAVGKLLARANLRYRQAEKEQLSVSVLLDIAGVLLERSSELPPFQ